MGVYPWDVSRPAHKRMIKFNFFQGAEALSFEFGGSHQEKPRRHSRPVLYALSASPRQPGWSHWQVSSVMFFASSQTSLQYFCLSAGIQLQAGCAHFFTSVISSPLVG